MEQSVPGSGLGEAASVVAAVAVRTVVAQVVAEVGAAAPVDDVAAGNASAAGFRDVEGAGSASGGGVEEVETYDASVGEAAEWEAAEAATQTAFVSEADLVEGQAEGRRAVVRTASGPPYRLASGVYVLAVEDMGTVTPLVAYPGHN